MITTDAPPAATREDRTLHWRPIGTTQQLVLTALADGPATTKAIAASLERLPQEVRRACEGLQARKLIRQQGDVWEVLG